MKMNYEETKRFLVYCEIQKYVKYTYDLSMLTKLNLQIYAMFRRIKTLLFEENGSVTQKDNFLK